MDSRRTSWISLNREFRQSRTNFSINFLNRFRNRIYICWPLWFIDYKVFCRIIAISLIHFSLWTISYSWFEDEVFPPDGPIFTLYLLTISAYLGGLLFGKFTPIPPILVMLLIGILFANIGLLKTNEEHIKIISVIRHFALTVILIRAGTGLDAKALRLLGGMVLRLTIIPASVEMIVLTITAYFLLDLPWLWGALLGSIMAAVSPAIIVPTLLSLHQKGYGSEKGVSTLVIAAAGLDDVFAISIFEILLSVIFSTGSLFKILSGPISIVVGIAFGIIWGFLCIFVPDIYDEYATSLRVIILTSGCLMAMFGSEIIQLEASGSLAVIILSFIAYNGWIYSGLPNDNSIINIFSILWTIVQPELFALIGSEVKFNMIDPTTLLWGLICMIIGILLRSLSCLVVTLGGNFNFKERLFIAIAWLPKATVQAALGPIAYDYIRTTFNEPEKMEELEYARIILILAAVSILLTAPLGAILLPLTGPYLLSKEDDTNPNPRDLHDSVIVHHL